MSNGSSHRGQASTDRFESEWPNLRLIHLPFYASWLNQIEIVYSVIQRKVLTPNDFETLQQVVDRLDQFEHHYNQIATPFDWTSPAATSSNKSPASPNTSHDSRSQPDHPRINDRDH